MNSWGNFKTDKLIRWINEVYVARINAFSLKEFIKQIEPFGGSPVVFSRENYWKFETLSLADFWMEEIERRYGLLATRVSDHYGPKGKVIRLLYQPDLIYALTLGKNHELKRKLIELRKKDQKYGQRRKA
jgi:hypothetical protein